MLNSRQYFIVDLLVKTPTPKSIDEIAKITNKSKRTIMRDLSTIKLLIKEKSIGEVKKIDRNGYKIHIHNIENYESFMSENVNDEEIILYELIQNKFVTIEALSEKLYLSKIASAEKLNVVKETYQNIINIEFNKKGHYLAESLETQCFLLSNLISNNLKKYLRILNLDYKQHEILEMVIANNTVIQSYFPNVSPIQIANLIIASLLFEKNIDANKKNDFIELFRSCSLDFNNNTISILSAVSDVCIETNNSLSIKKIEDVLAILENKNGIILDRQLANQLYHHLKRMLCYPYYLKIGEIHNIENIKATFPFSFDLSISFIKLMNQIYGYKIANQDLVGLYFSISLDNNVKQFSKIIIYSKDNAIAHINKQLLEGELDTCEIEISCDVDYISKSDAILIVNTSNEKSIFEKEEIYIHSILSEKDISSMKEYLEQIRISKTKESIFIRKESYCYDVKDNETLLDILENICQKLLRSKTINYDEYSNIIEREKLGNSLIIENYLIPHCISKKENFCISIYVHLSKSINVDDRFVNNLLITVMSPKVHSDMNIFKFLYRYINKNAKELRKASKYDEFVEFL